MTENTEEEVKKVRRLSTNPFLYEDGSLVEDEVLRVLERESSSEAEKDSDSEHTPKAEIPPRQLWSSSKAGAMSIDMDEDKVS